MTTVVNNLDKARMAYRSAMGVAIVAGVFSLVVAIQMAASYVQLAARPSLAIPALDRMRSELRDRPDDAALKEEIRALDLLARRAYFTNLGAMRTGGVLLLGGVVVTLASLRLMNVLRRQLPDPKQYGSPVDPWEHAGVERWAVAGTAGVLIAAAIVLAVISGGEGRMRPLPRVQEATAVRPPPVSQPTLPTARPVARQADLIGEEEFLKNWPCFRGPGGLGIAYSTNVPTAWDGRNGSNIVWKAGVPRPGSSSPVVWGKRLVVSGADKIAREVFCYNADTGELLWRTAVAGIPGSPAELPPVSADTGWAASTMATDGKHAFAIFATAEVVSFDAEGRQVWGRNLGVLENNYGHAASLITCGGLLMVPFDSSVGGRVLALDTATGKTMWDQVRPNIQNSWASPVLVHTGRRMELILNASPRVAGYDPATGKELWSVECMGGEVASSAAYAADMVFVANEFVRLAAVKLGDTPAMVWEYSDDLPSVSSPVATGQFVFMASSGGTVTCLDSKTGAVMWKQEFSKGFYSSPILVGDRLYLMDIAGVMHVMAVDKVFRLLGESDLGESSVCTPAFVNGRVYIRGRENLYCVGAK